jgi:RND family efflux transporter MFP subunit
LDEAPWCFHGAFFVCALTFYIDLFMFRRVLWSVAVGGAFVSTNALALECLIEPNQVVDIASPVVGLLEKTHVKRGDVVSKGQVLAVLESRSEQYAAESALYRSSLLGPTMSAESKIDFSRKKFARKRDLSNAQHVAQQERDEAESELKQAEAELQVAKENKQLAKIEHQQQSSQLALRTLRSPFSGVVVDQSAFVGEVVEPTGSTKKNIFRLAQIDPLKVRLVLPMSLFGQMKVGASVSVTPELSNSASYSAKVKMVDRVIDASSGTFVVLLEMPNPSSAIPSGVRCRASFPQLSSK